MTVSELSKKLSLKVLVEGDTINDSVKGCYIGDLLSWVMGRATAGEAWITVMGNINAIAVAVLADVSCIILSENATLDENAKSKAEMQGVTILAGEENSYKIATGLYDLLNGEK